MVRKLGLILGLVLLLAGCNGGGEAAGENPIAEPGDAVQAGWSESDTEEVISPKLDVNAVLSGLTIDAFFEQAFELILTRDPEWVVELGIPGLNADEIALTDVSPEALEINYQIDQEVLALLRDYDFDQLTDSQQISYQVFEWFLLEQTQAYQDENFNYLVNPVGVRSSPQLYVMFFTDSHPFNTVVDAEAYVARVRLLDGKIDQLIARMEAQADAGMIAPRIVLEYGQSDFRRMIGSSASSSPLRATFREKAAGIEGLDESAFNALDQSLMTALQDEVYPAFGRLNDLLIELQREAPDVLGLSALPGGADYYQRQLRHFTTTDLTAEEIHTAGLAEVSRIQAEMRERFSVLGYPEDESIPELYQRLITESGTLRGDAITAEYERILQEADELVAASFEQRPAGELEVVGGNVGAFYSPGSYDGTRPGRFYARINQPEPIYQMRSLAYHEGIPGHHYQITLAARADLPFFRNLVGYTGYIEGWALYAEYLAYDLGWYADDPYGDLGRLQYEALRACRMVVDTGIHSMGWEFQETVDYMIENTGFDSGFMEYEVIRYISYPAQATAYLVGKNEILRMRTAAEEALGEEFVLAEFHSVILENGSMPLEVLEALIEEWVDSKSDG